MRKTKEGLNIIMQEEADICELCGKKAELRPYGPNGENVCFQCGMKNEDAAKRQLQRLFDGKDIEKNIVA